MAQDIIRVSITEEGIVKLDTDRISPVNHVTAEKLVGEIAKLAGGSTTRKHKHGKSSHSHTHSESEEHHH